MLIINESSFIVPCGRNVTIITLRTSEVSTGVLRGLKKARLLIFREKNFGCSLRCPKCIHRSRPLPHALSKIIIHVAFLFSALVPWDVPDVPGTVENGHMNRTGHGSLALSSPSSNQICE